ncbi:MAG: hypothetical protein ACQSGP_08015 [Frankia sp.]
MTEPLLPDQTGDDTDVGWGDERDNDRDDDDARLRDDLPPHHVDRDR